MIEPGQKLSVGLPLNILQGEEAKEVSLGDLLTRRTIVSVYMRNHTGGCDRQNESLVQQAAAFAKAGYNVVAVSRDPITSHRKYAAKKGITHALVSDPEDRFARATGSIIEKSMYGRKYRGPARAAYVLDRDGTVLAVIPKVDTAGHAAQLLAVIATLA